MINWKKLALGIFYAVTLASCSSTKPAEPISTASSDSTSQQSSTPGQTSSLSSSGSISDSALDPLNNPNSVLAKHSIYFAFDSSVINDDGESVIKNHSDYIKANAKRKVTIQGNTDARGSREYNLALGQRRAESVKHAMEMLGIPANQLEAVSFGKERPKATGNTEADYAENRRVDIVYNN